jgi:hypothetical protein
VQPNVQQLQLCGAHLAAAGQPVAQSDASFTAGSVTFTCGALTITIPSQSAPQRGMRDV